ncbi:uncharacterized protein PG986_008959 [Apiospora aurea]|uniref:C2H2-type domain-containing protein n=1 Tax=Apiospora aurea TaxID=335848 RepID=A0ABR1Q6H8_9PEZI
MSDNFDYVDFNTLLNQAAYLGTHATEPDPGQVSLADSPFLGDDSLLDRSYYAGTQEIHPNPNQAANAHTEELDLYGTGVSASVSEAPFGWTANVGTFGFPPGFNQVTAPGSLYGCFGVNGGFDIDNTVVNAGGFLLPNDALPFVTGTALGALSEPPLPANSVGQGFATGDILDTTAAPAIGQQQARDEFALWQPDAGLDATADQVDALHRHIDGYAKDVPKFPCRFCKFHRGKHGFRRRDHLIQHLRGYHKFDDEEVREACPTFKLGILQPPTCPHRGCEFFRDDSFHKLTLTEKRSRRPFSTRSALSKHLKEVHKQTPFPCDVEDCAKVGAKGYVREKDLMKHRAAKHPEAPGYTAKPRQPGYPCEIDGCVKTYTSASARHLHRLFKH